MFLWGPSAISASDHVIVKVAYPILRQCRLHSVLGVKTFLSIALLNSSLLELLISSSAQGSPTWTQNLGQLQQNQQPQELRRKLERMLERAGKFVLHVCCRAEFEKPCATYLFRNETVLAICKTAETVDSTVFPTVPTGFFTVGIVGKICRPKRMPPRSWVRKRPDFVDCPCVPSLCRYQQSFPTQN